ncbi:MAG: thioredoxin family protein [Promethearchaeota archaeon]
MSDDNLENNMIRKTEMNLKLKHIPRNFINVANEKEFNELLENFPDYLFVIDFWAIWCAPCKSYAPIFEKASLTFSRDFTFLKINVDDNQKITRLYGIKSIPTTLILKGKQIMRKFTGAVTYDILKQILEKFL